MSGINKTLLTTLLATTLLVTGCGEIKDYISYLLESKEQKAERDKEFAKWEVDRKSYEVAYDNCVDVVRAKTDASTLQFPENMQDLGNHHTDNGWKVNIFADDIKGSYTFTCYTDKSGNILRMAVDDRNK